MITSIVLLVLLLGLITLLVFWKRAESALLQWQIDRGNKPDNTAKRGTLEDARNGRIMFSNIGLNITDKKGRFTKIGWDDIVQISAYKADLLTIDLIIIRFQYKADGELSSIDLDEEMLGFNAMTDKVAKEFSFVNNDWWMDVTFPAFAENHTILWSRHDTLKAQVD